MRIIIVGGGKVGSRLAQLFVADKHEVSVIEGDEGVAEELSTGTDALVLRGDGTDRKTLVDAGIEDADYFVTTTNDDKANLLASQIAKKYGAKKTVARVSDPENYELFMDMDIQPINEALSTVTAIYNNLFAADRQNLVAYIAEERAEISKLIVSKKSELLGKKIKDTPVNKYVFFVQRDTELIFPDEKTTLMEGDIVYAVSPREETHKIVTNVRGENH